MQGARIGGHHQCVHHKQLQVCLKDRGGVLRIIIQFDATAAKVDLIDDGPGFPADAVNGLGMQIIKAMARQIDAEALWQKAEMEGVGAHLRLIISTRVPVDRSG